MTKLGSGGTGVNTRRAKRLSPTVVLLGALAIVLSLATAVGAQDSLPWEQVGDDVQHDFHEGAFGRGLDLNAAGNRMVVGEPHNDTNGFHSGKVRVFDLLDGEWVQVGQDIDGASSFDNLGDSVAISAAGSRIALSILQVGDAPRPGIVRVYDLVGTTWTQVGDDLVGQDADEQFGSSVSISADGDRVAVGAPWADGNLTRFGGEVRAYDLVDGAWIQAGGDIPGNGLFGADLALGGGGSRLVVGAPSYSELGIRRGQVQAFVLFEGAWVQIGLDINGEDENDTLGNAVDISDRGWTIVTGSAFNSAAGDRAGHVRVYGLFNWNWVQFGPDIDGQTEGEWSGWSVSISADGTRIAVGNRVTERSNVGLARIYRREGGTWIQLGDDLLEGQANGALVENVVITPDGQRVAVGATLLDEEGVVRVFDFVPEPEPELPVGPEPVGPEPEPESESESAPVMCGGVEATIVGTPGNDALAGTDGPDVIAGLQGDDIITGLGGDDILCGGQGNDLIFGGQGFDIIFGAQGNDRIFSTDGSDFESRTDTRGMRAFGGAGDDVIYGSDRWDRMQGGPGDDLMFGYEGRDWMRGGANADKIDGGAGVDNLHGGNGNDIIQLTQSDKVRGGAGNQDTCISEGGSPSQIISCERRSQ